MPEKGYDDFKGLDVAGKVVLISMGYPGYMDTTSHGFKKMQEFGVKNYSRWNKYQEAVKRGASAVLFLYTTPEWFDPTGNDYHNYTYDEKKPDTPEPDIVIAPDTVESQTPFLMVSSRVGHALLTGTGVDLVQYNIRNALECKPSSVLLKDKTVKLVVDNTTELIRSANIIGAIPGENPDEFVVVGAHYDHIGKESGEINYGSDDNASGAVAVMAIAKACREMKVKPKRTILFALWTGEEEGLLGSRFFMRHWKQGKIDSYFNFDMVSRYNPKDSANYLTINLPKGQTSFEELLTKLNNTGPDALQIRCVYEAEEDYGGSDYAPFAVRKIPFCWFFTGFHVDYHKESDTFDKANINDMTRIANLGFKAVWDEANQ
jgi:hypothetical protein